MTPTQLTLRKLRADGWPLVQVVERWNQFARRRQDLFGFDVIAIRDNRMIWVQCTTATNVSARLNKLAELPSTEVLKALSSSELWVWGWQKNKSGRYELKREVRV